MYDNKTITTFNAILHTKFKLPPFQALCIIDELQSLQCLNIQESFLVCLKHELLAHVTYATKSQHVAAVTSQ